MSVMRTRHVLALLLVMGAGCGPRLMGVVPGGEDSGGAPQLDSGRLDGDAGAAPLDAGRALPVVTVMTPAGSSWFDPEVLEVPAGPTLMTWQDDRAEVWVAQLDPATGQVAPGAGWLMGRSAAPLSRTFNGPELGLDTDGWAIYYTRAGADGGHQAARSRLVGGTPRLDVLTSGEEHFTPLASKWAQSPSTRLLMMRRTTGWGTALWLDANAPQAPHDLFHLAARTDADIRWVDGTFSAITNNHPTFPREVSWVDTESGVVTRISNGEGAFDRPYGWRVPGETGFRALAVVDATRLQVWQSDGGAWRAVESLTSPEPGFPFLGSPEPFVVAGRSYASFTVSSAASINPGRSEQHVWIVSLDPAHPFAERCDDGEPGPLTRVDPEVASAGQRLFVYYYVLSPGSSRVYVCATGLPP